ncbi:MAG TPA: capsule assembly Wzi family protein [Spirosoma sp.]|nr:capsule assembly Wzi family protein [Spirosoma sp.]
MGFRFIQACCFFLICSIGEALGQRVSQYHTEVGGMASTDQTPFWLRANQYGVVPLRGPVYRVNAGVYSDYRRTDSVNSRPVADWGYGANVVVNAGNTKQVLVPEAYVKARLWVFELYAGRRRELVGLVDTLLTSGAYAWSGNALPIPKIQIGIPTFTSVPFTKGVLSLMGVFAHGWFEKENRLVKGSYLHQTYGYGRLGKPTWPFRLYAGFNHQVIWAGRAAPGVIHPTVSVDGQLPSALKYFPAVVFGTTGTQVDQVATEFEANRVGNHLGSLDFAADVNIGHWNAYLYRQFLYDDGSLYYGTNLEDGLNGLRFKNRKAPGSVGVFLRQVTVEFLNTYSQGGSEFINDDNLRRGRDNYFNHEQFIDGWVYHGRVIGTPFLTPQREVRPELRNTGPHNIGNNRVKALHLGISALLFNAVDFTTRLSVSRNAGTYNNPYVDSPQQFSGALTASVPLTWLGGMVLNGTVAVDRGGLLPNSTGGYLGLRKNGLLGGRRSPATRPKR